MRYECNDEARVARPDEDGGQSTVRATVDRLPLLALAVLLAVSWLGADYYHTHAVISTNTPFTPVYAAYDRGQAATLLGWCFLGLLAAWAVPLRGGVRVSALRDRAGSIIGDGVWIWAVGAVAGVALMVYAKGSYLWVAPDYLAWKRSLPIVSLAGLAAPLGILASGVLMRRHPYWGSLLFTLNMLGLFAGATRLFCGSLLLFLAGRYLAGLRTTLWHWLMGGIFALLTLPIPLFLRSLAEHGLSAYLPGTIQLVRSGEYFQQIPLLFGENVGFGIPLLVFVSQMPTVTYQDLFIQLNPLPAYMTNWPSIADGMRVNSFAPYSALGEWANLGLGTLFLLVFAWGLLCRLTLWVTTLTLRTSNLALVLIGLELALAMLSTLVLTQYNTRATSRLLDIQVCLALVAYLVHLGQSQTARGVL